jgi:virginiamycin B lyase
MGGVWHRPVTEPNKGDDEQAEARLATQVAPEGLRPQSPPARTGMQTQVGKTHKPADGDLRRRFTAATRVVRRRFRAAPALQRDLAFWGALLLLAALTLLALTQVGGALSRPAVSGPPEPTAPAIPAKLIASVRSGNVKMYALPNPAAGLMQPAVDQHGAVWVGEMDLNRLAALDPSSGQVHDWQPPNSQHAIMATQVDAQGRVWFTEQAAGYIGRFDPATRTFKTYPLPQSDGRNAGPQDLRFDASGKLYVTLASSGRIGRLDPATGALDTWSVPAPAPGVHPTPWALAVTPTGQVWFGLLSGGAVGRLNPASGQVTLIHLADPQAAVFSMAAGGNGLVYFTELQAGKLGVIETATGKLRELDVPAALGDPTSLYAVGAAPNGDAWFASSGANALVRFAPQAGAFTFYRLPVPTSVPYGVALGASGTVWFAADDPNGNYIGALTPAA